MNIIEAIYSFLRVTIKREYLPICQEFNGCCQLPTIAHKLSAMILISQRGHYLQYKVDLTVPQDSTSQNLL